MYYGERLNSISHLVGAVLALIGLGALLTVGVQSGSLRMLHTVGMQIHRDERWQLLVRAAKTVQ